MLITESKTIVRYVETDRMGIVHHSNYPIWFEIGRTDFIKEAGISYSAAEKQGLFLPLIELGCSFKEALTYEDQIVIRTQVNKLTYSRITFYYEIYKDDKEYKLAALGETTHVWTDSSLKPINIRKKFPDMYLLISNIL